MIKVVTVATRNCDGLEALQRSAVQYGMDLTVLGMNEGWKGFGMKVILTYNYLKTLQGFSHFIFVDAFDTLFIRPVTEYSGGILFSAEKQAWPDADAPYPASDAVWKYLNSGSYIAPVKEYLELIEGNPIDFAEDDQRYFTRLYLAGHGRLDTECNIFQSYAFSQPGDFTIRPDKFINNITGSQPAVIHFNGRSFDNKINIMTHYSTLSQAQQAWQEQPEVHKAIHEAFIELVNQVPELKQHRDFVEHNVFGFGERSFHWFWYLLIKEMPAKFSFLEIGVLKGQTLSLCKLIADMLQKKVTRYGITPLSTEGGVWESNYEQDIELIHEKYGLEKDYKIFKGLSEDEKIIKKAAKLKLDILYIDGGHEERHITNDIENYSGLVKPGGFMVIDDCCNSFHMPFGYFQGIEAVSKVVDRLLPPVTSNDQWQFIFSVVHLRIYRRQ